MGTALDVARIVNLKSLIERLETCGAKSSSELPAPPWPRPEIVGMPERTWISEAPSLPPLWTNSKAPLPDIEKGHAAGVQNVMASLRKTMQEHQCDTYDDRVRLFKQLVFEWHPDKRHQSEIEIATAVCQWLLGPARCFLVGSEMA